MGEEQEKKYETRKENVEEEIQSRSYANRPLAFEAVLGEIRFGQKMGEK